MKRLVFQERFLFPVETEIVRVSDEVVGRQKENRPLPHAGVSDDPAWFGPGRIRP